MGTSIAAAIDRHNLAMLPNEAEVGVPGDEEGIENLSITKSISWVVVQRNRELGDLSLPIIHINHFSLHHGRLRLFRLM